MCRKTQEKFVKNARLIPNTGHQIENPAVAWYYFVQKRKRPDGRRLCLQRTGRTERCDHFMTIQECYAQMGADYNEVFRRLYNEAMIRKFVLLFPKDDSFHKLEVALREQNVKEAFRAAHTLKGVCQNLGFSNLYAPAVTLTETLRAGQLDGTAEQFAEVEKQYRITMAAIQALD